MNGGLGHESAWLKPHWLGLIWLVLLAGILVSPTVFGSSTAGDDLTRNTIRLALLYYAVAASLMLWFPGTAQSALTSNSRLARWCWTLAWAAYLVHLGMAFHHYHDWSHARAVEHTRSVSGVGEGIYVSHLFTALWTLDVASWWLAPFWHASRRAWMNIVLHCFMLFVIVNGTIVYEEGFIRWAGVALVEELGRLYVNRHHTFASARLTKS
jgi:hypothetical protein